MAVTNPDPLAALFQRHVTQHGYTLLADAAAADAFLAGPGDRLLLLAEAPHMVPESWDVAVILPEVLAPVAGRFQVGLLSPALARPIATRYAVNLWPALLFVRDGQYVGTLAGMRDWADYQREVPTFLDRPASRAPGIGIPVASATDSACH